MEALLSRKIKVGLADRCIYFSFNYWPSIDERLTSLRNPNKIARG